MRYEEATINHPSAQGVVATRDPDAERGVGRAFRHEPNMLPQQAAALRVQQPGMSSVRSASIGRAVQSNKDLIGRTGRLSVAVRSGNVDPAAIGLNKSNWGLASIGDDVPATAPIQSKLFLIGGIAALAAVFLLRSR